MCVLVQIKINVNKYLFREVIEMKLLEDLNNYRGFILNLKPGVLAVQFIHQFAIIYKKTQNTTWQIILIL
jgi:hypothetical protein